MYIDDKSLSNFDIKIRKKYLRRTYETDPEVLVMCKHKNLGIPAKHHQERQERPLRRCFRCPNQLPNRVNC